MMPGTDWCRAIPLSGARPVNRNRDGTEGGSEILASILPKRSARETGSAAAVPEKRRLRIHAELLTAKPREEPTHPEPIGWHHTRARQLAGLSVQPLRGDLRAVLIQTHHDRHSSLLEHTTRTTRAARGLHPGQNDTRLMPSLRDKRHSHRLCGPLLRLGETRPPGRAASQCVSTQASRAPDSSRGGTPGEHGRAKRPQNAQKSAREFKSKGAGNRPIRSV